MADVLSDGSLFEVVSQYTRLEPFGPGWFRGQCPFCRHEDAEFTLFPWDGALLYACANCRVQGDVDDFLAAMDGANGRGPGALGGAAMLEAIVAFVRRFVALGYDQAVLLALWVVRTHALDAADTTP